MWGKLAFSAYRNGSPRSIPTGVGKTKRRFIVCERITVHPHGCGENYLPWSRPPEYDGPSPRVWGKRKGFEFDVDKAGSIPTGVGKTIVLISRFSVTPVHPHGCGENWQPPPQFVLQHGPSPRVWGKLSIKHLAQLFHRSIPTGVGKTAGSLTGLNMFSVHPHGCGENDVSCRYNSSSTGPSPRVWGKQLARLSGEIAGRSIPTGVGKT